MISFKSILYLLESSESSLEERTGASFLNDQVMLASMYLAYRAAYNDVAKKDHEEAIEELIKKGISREEAEEQTTFQPAWPLNQWNSPIRLPKWIFYGKFPSEQDLILVAEKLSKYNGNIQKMADNENIQLPNVGGISYRFEGDDLKLTGLWGWNSKAKMLAVVNVTHKANQSGKSIFTGADSQLMDMIKRAEPLLAKLHQKDPAKVPSPQLGLSTPPKEIIPFLYDIIVNHPLASGGGYWAGHNPDGSLNFDLSGIGMRRKFLLGNKSMWGNNIKKATSRLGVDSDMLNQLKSAMSNDQAADMATAAVNNKIQKMAPGTKPITRDALKWIVQQVS